MKKIGGNLEEKIYFKPEKRKKKGWNYSHKIAKVGIIIVLLIASVLLIIFFLRGKESTNGKYPDNVKNESVTCTINNKTPAKIEYVESESREIKINAIFNDKDTIKRIHLTYTQAFKTDDEAYGAEAKIHASFNKMLVSSGYPTDQFENKFSRYNNTLYISLSAGEKDLDAFSAPYFMINRDNDEEIKSVSLYELRKNYENQGFTCGVPRSIQQIIE